MLSRARTYVPIAELVKRSKATSAEVSIGPRADLNDSAGIAA